MEDTAGCARRRSGGRSTSISMPMEAYLYLRYSRFPASSKAWLNKAQRPAVEVAYSDTIWHTAAISHATAPSPYYVKGTDAPIYATIRVGCVSPVAQVELLDAAAASLPTIPARVMAKAYLRAVSLRSHAHQEQRGATVYRRLHDLAIQGDVFPSLSRRRFFPLN
jgi:hypothetical protein